MSVSITLEALGGDSASELVQLHVWAQDPDWAGLFDAIEVERSRGLSTGPFEPLTEATWESARLPVLGGEPASVPPVGPALDIVGDTLDLLVNETDAYSVLFTDPGAGTLTLSEAASQITATIPALSAWVDASAQLVLATKEVGTGASLRILGGDAAPKLGLAVEEPSSLAYGYAARMALIPGKELYTFTDLRGSSAFFYRTRFINSYTGAVSGYTQPRPPAKGEGLSPEHLVRGQVSLVDLSGRPLRGAQVNVYTCPGLWERQGKLIARSRLHGITGTDGIASFMLVRGVPVEVVIDGTSLVRQIQVPTDSSISVFNLLDPEIGPDDYFRVRHPHVEYAYKRSI